MNIAPFIKSERTYNIQNNPANEYLKLFERSFSGPATLHRMDVHACAHGGRTAHRPAPDHRAQTVYASAMVVLVQLSIADCCRC